MRATKNRLLSKDRRFVRLVVGVFILFCPRLGFATPQDGPTQIVDQGDGKWKLEGALGGYAILLVDSNRTPRLTLRIENAFPAETFRKYVGRSSAGPIWSEFALPYFVSLAERPHFCVRTWWDDRILIDLDAAKQASPIGFEKALEAAERSVALSVLKTCTPLHEGKTTIQYVTEYRDALAAIHVAGRLKMEEAVEFLRRLETSDRIGSSGGEGQDTPSHEVFSIRRCTQRTLRLMGLTPKPLPATAILRGVRISKHADLIRSRPRNERLVERGMNALDVLELLGSPDYFERARGQGSAWRYDIDGRDPHTLLVIVFNQEVQSIERHRPGLWHGSDLQPIAAEKAIFTAEGEIADLTAFYQLAEAGLQIRQIATADAFVMPKWTRFAMGGVVLLAATWLWLRRPRRQAGLRE